MSASEAVRSTVYLEPDLHQALRLKSAHSQRSMSDIVNEALRQTLREDQEDLAAVRGRSKERAMTYEEFLDRVRQGVYRILYGIHDEQIMVEAIRVGHRGEVYRTR